MQKQFEVHGVPRSIARDAWWLETTEEAKSLVEQAPGDGRGWRVLPGAARRRGDWRGFAGSAGRFSVLDLGNRDLIGGFRLGVGAVVVQHASAGDAPVVIARTCGFFFGLPRQWLRQAFVPSLLRAKAPEVRPEAMRKGMKALTHAARKVPDLVVLDIGLPEVDGLEVSRPIRDLERFAAAQERGDRPEPPQHFGTRELHATGQRVIIMAEALRTPAAAIRAGVELLENSAGLTPEDHRLLTQFDSARQQLEAQLSALRDAARARETRYLGHSTLAELLPLIRADWPGLTVQVTGDQVAIPLASDGLHIILGHLLRNAGEHGADKVVRNILQAHHGSISLKDHARGALFQLAFSEANPGR